jgi:hypothetical protein
MKELILMTQVATVQIKRMLLGEGGCNQLHKQYYLLGTVSNPL